jgi:hypothetical protein
MWKDKRQLKIYTDYLLRVRSVAAAGSARQPLVLADPPNTFFWPTESNSIIFYQIYRRMADSESISQILNYYEAIIIIYYCILF